MQHTITYYAVPSQIVPKYKLLLHIININFNIIYNTDPANHVIKRTDFF